MGVEVAGGGGGDGGGCVDGGGGREAMPTATTPVTARMISALRWKGV